MKLETNSRRSYILPVGSIVVILLVLYPLSAPPVEILFRRGYLPITDDQGRAFYAPLVWLNDNFDWCKRLFLSYYQLWEPLYP